jgi:hypothetical protein
MKINFFGAASAVLAAFLVYSASAQDSHWSGLGGDSLWSNPNNWNSVGVPPSSMNANVWLDSAKGWPAITTADGDVESPGGGSGDMIYGPEFGAGLNIYDTLNWRDYLVPVRNDPAHSIITTRTRFLVFLMTTT